MVKTRSTLRTNQKDTKTYSRRWFLLQRCFSGWKKSTFGRVSPNIARDFHKRRLLYRCLLTWVKKHSQNHREWKLMIRAEYHERYHVWQVCFRNWKEFVKISKHESLVIKKAENHGDKILKKRYFKVWRRYVLIQNKSKINKKLAEDFIQVTYLKKSWQVWQQKFHHRQQLEHMNYMALYHWAMQKKKMAFHWWFGEYVQQKRIHLQMEYSVSVYNHKLISLTINQWMKYFAYRKEKRKEKEAVQSVWVHNTRWRYFNQWKKAWFARLHVHEMEQIILQNGETSLKRRMFIYWRQYVCYKHDCFKKLRKALNFHKKCLKKRYFSYFKSFCHTEQLYKSNLEKAKLFYITKKTAFFFNRWTDQLEIAEEKKIYPLSKYARDISNRKLVVQSFKKWHDYIIYKRISKQKMSKAESFYLTKIKPRYFYQWIIYVQQHKDKVGLIEEANMFHKNLLYAKYFYSWLKQYKILFNVKELEIIAVEHIEEKLLSRAFSQWQESIDRKRRIDMIQLRAIEFRKTNSLVSVWNIWVARWREKAVWKNKESFADKFFARRLLLQPCFTALKKYCVSSKILKKKEEDARKHYSMHMKRKYLQRLKENLVKSQQIYTEAETRYKKKALCSKRWAFDTWQSNISLMKRFQCKMEFAEEFHNDKLLKKVFITIKMHAIEKVNKRFYEDDKLFRAQIHLENFTKQIYLGKWKRNHSEKVEMEKKTSIAIQHWKFKLLVHCFHQLKFYVHARNKKLCLERKCRDLNNILIQRRCVIAWKAKVEDVKIERRNTYRALWWWSHQLQYKVLRAWIIYKDDKKSKKKDYDDAMEYYKNSMRNYGITKWIQIATRNIEERKKMVADYNNRRNVELQNIVHKYAMLWLAKTKFKKRKDDNSSSTGIRFESKFLNRQESRIAIVAKHANKKCSSSNFLENRSIFIPTARAREKPRKPDYLRDSFDLSRLKPQKLNASDFEPRSDVYPVDQSKTSFQMSRDTFDVTNATTDLREMLKETPPLLPPSSFSTGFTKGVT